MSRSVSGERRSNVTQGKKLHLRTAPVELSDLKDLTNRRDALKLGVATTVSQVVGEVAYEAMGFARRAGTCFCARCCFS
ncbi:hypothetical protein SAMN05421869_113335 [Nonomuraea jiangxiensis]|uniref:Uncharacterized protein n=1 Tax=Nonomuraea jiangxiensis TaxID=633440 RepID=A0A1G8YP33_9ACTN|nr:hypothetical protein SAMN05421869_113335 [Nonomuraea jiangxiensis]